MQSHRQAHPSNPDAPTCLIIVMGVSGSGKSTLARMLSGLLRPDSGAIYWNGQPVNDPAAFPVSLSLPLAAPEHQGLRVRHWLRGLLPDNEARLQEIERRIAIWQRWLPRRRPWPGADHQP